MAITIAGRVSDVHVDEARLRICRRCDGYLKCLKILFFQGRELWQIRKIYRFAPAGNGDINPIATVANV